METYLPITYLNDFVFCPRSIYYHQLYGQYDSRLYHRNSQIQGKIKHESIEKGSYSTLNRYLLNIDVYSEKYGICGKIDVYDQEDKKIIERKGKIKTIYEGYLYQIYAHYFCLTEMGFGVDSLCLHSLDDNKRYNLPIPDDATIKKFEGHLLQVKKFNLLDSFQQIEGKCRECIYNPLCDIC